MKRVRLIETRIKQLRLMLVLHSYIYYQLDTSLITDAKWQEIANELVQLQQGGCPQIGTYDEAFEDWDGTTGHHLPCDAWVKFKAQYLVDLCQRLAVVPIQRRPVTKQAVQRSIFDL